MNVTDKIYVAGHNGLVGSAIVRRLKDLNFNNLILKDRSQLDLTIQDDVENFFQSEKPDYVFLAAAKVGGILYNKTFPANFIRDNLLIQTNVIDSAYKNGVKKLLFLGSSCIYPEKNPQPIKESYLLNSYLEKSNIAYAIAKISGLIMCQKYKEQYNFDAISVMPTNIYGKYDNFDIQQGHVLPAFINKFITAKKNNDPHVICWGDGTSRREFLYSDDLADACIHLMNNYSDSEIINIGTGKDISIKELAEIIKKEVDFKGEIIWDTTKPNGTMEKRLDVSKLNDIGWYEKTPLKEGIRSTIKWFYENEMK